MSGIAGIILAGGRSSRMGGAEKSLLSLGGRTLIERVAQRLAGQSGLAAINANGDPDRFQALGLPVIPDEIPDAGPLGGIQAGLAWAASRGATHILTVAADTPFFPEDLATRLASVSETVPVLASSNGRVHPVFGLWPVAAEARLRDWLSQDRSKAVQAFAEHQGFLTAGFPVPVIAGGKADPFFNINTPEDLAEAERLAARLG